MISKLKYDIEKLSNSEDEELVGLIYNKACELHFGTFGQSFEIENSAIKELFATWILDSEVKNGGFDQFFLNNGIEWAEIAKNGLERIEAFEFIALINRAIQVYKNQGVENEIIRNPEFNTLDDEYYDKEEQLGFLQLKYIKSNYGKFVVNEIGK